ncbi:MAG TPA: nicotinate (nicotinamide) nucleotide adenylyltransferase, partial [Gemmatimonadaceae bacterium]|nr:nicotinate (nicotinamide) nucleotide adenylyltransferase [Gemmatimonadaceae bacterium]
MRLGIFGGSFDPPHLGHLLPVIDAAESLGLDAVRFVPAGIQPFKVGRASAAPEHRLAMTTRLVAGVPGFSADSSEIDRGGLSYTVDTLGTLSRTSGADELVLLVGADAFAMFDQWREPERIAELATIAVLVRGEAPLPELKTGRAVQLLRTRRVDISSTELRARVADGRTIRGFVPDAVA